MSLQNKTKFKKTEIGLIPEDWEVKGLNSLGKVSTGKGTKKLLLGKYKIIGSNGVLGYTNNYLENDNLIFTGRVGTIGSVNFLKKERVWLSDNTLYFKTEDLGLLKFIYYSLKRIDFSYLNVGSTQPLIKQSDFRRLKIGIPTHKTEINAIVKILSDLDAKIELLQKQNETLEKIGQALFKRWFVDFEFLNEEGKPYKSSGGKMVYNKELGKEIPKGWEVSEVGKELKTILGGTPSKTRKEYWINGTIPWINSGALNAFPVMNASQYITKEGLKNSAAKLMPRGTIVLPFVISIGKKVNISILGIDSSGNQSVLGILENKLFSSAFIYYWIQHKKQKLYLSATGGAQQHINKKEVDSLELLIPSKQVLIEFNNISMKLIKKIISNAEQIQSLEQIRDSLLPKLMTGKIRVNYEKD